MPKVLKLPRGKGKLLEIFTLRKIGMRTPSEWPLLSTEIECRLTSTKASDIEAVIKALKDKSLTFQNLA